MSNVVYRLDAPTEVNDSIAMSLINSDVPEDISLENVTNLDLRAKDFWEKSDNPLDAFFHRVAAGLGFFDFAQYRDVIPETRVNNLISAGMSFDRAFKVAKHLDIPIARMACLGKRIESYSLLMVEKTSQEQRENIEKQITIYIPKGVNCVKYDFERIYPEGVPDEQLPAYEREWFIRV